MDYSNTATGDERWKEYLRASAPYPDAPELGHTINPGVAIIVHYPPHPSPDSIPDPAPHSSVPIQPVQPEVFQIVFVLGDKEFKRWLLREQYGIQEPRDDESPNTWVMYRNSQGEVLEYRVVLRTSDFRHWMQLGEEQEQPPQKGAGRRPARVMQMKTWRQHQKKPNVFW
jgi:hypothetical protein